jgi:hypothetical protein
MSVDAPRQTTFDFDAIVLHSIDYDPEDLYAWQVGQEQERRVRARALEPYIRRPKRKMRMK